MNIYLDIDGVLVGSRSPREDVIKLIRYILEHYPNNTYWLTTHCKGGVNRCIEWLKQNDFPVDLVDEMAKAIRPTDWGVLKTDAIDMDQDFIWFDDSLFEAEKKTLEAYYVMDGFYWMDPKDPEAAKKALEFLKSH
ncbi:hypothetical protein IKT18_00040 [Candidatus Saccharibacteria bacterium]|nr:hypothetical protein [Candidatus Saccharibacteria bacterium]